MKYRSLTRLIPAQDTSDGAGVRLRRSLGQSPFTRLDPFLMLDEFSSNDPNDYVAGFPAHPHRGFETVTYMLEGHMLHEDHLGNRGHLRSGGAQWMTAGRGIIHSEMPQQESGHMRGFQLWINLPAAEKMKPASYRDIQAEDLPIADLPQGGRIKVIAGTATLGSTQLAGPIQGLSTEPIYFDIHLPPHAIFEHSIAETHHSFLYAYEGNATVMGGSPTEPTEAILPHRAAGVLSEGNLLKFRAGAEGVQLIWLAGKPLHEPVVQYGPFVMNTREEIEQALHDYQAGQLTG